MKNWRTNGLVGLAVVALAGASVVPVAASDDSTVSGPSATTLVLDVAGPITGSCGDGAGLDWLDATTAALGDRVCWRATATFGSDGVGVDGLIAFTTDGSFPRIASSATGVDSTLEINEVGGWPGTAQPGDVAQLVLETVLDAPRNITDGQSTRLTAFLSEQGAAGGDQAISDTAELTVAAADLSIITTVTPDRAPASSTIDTTTTVSNSGSLPATTTFRTNLGDGIACFDVTSTDGGTCVDGTSGTYVEWVDVVIEPDASVGKDVHVTVPERFDPGRRIENCGEVIRYVTSTADGAGFVTVTSPFADDPSGPNADPIEDCDDTTVGDPLPEPTIEKTATTSIDGPGNGTTDAVAGETVTYEILVTVPEGAEFSSGTLTDTVPAGIELSDVAITTRGGTPIGFPVVSDATSFTVTWPSPYRNEAGSGDDQFLVTATGTVTTSTPGQLVNTAAFTSNVGTDTDDAPITVVDPPAPGPTVDKSADRATATIGETITYTIVADVPASSATRFDATVIDVLPAGLEIRGGFVGSTCDRDGASCSITAIPLDPVGDTTVGFWLGDLAPDTVDRTVIITYRALVTGAVTTADSLENTAAIVSNDTDKVPGDLAPGDPTPAPDEFDEQSPVDTTTVEIVEPLLVIDQDVNGQVDDTDERTGVPGEKLTYTIVVTNNGDGPAYDVVVTDAIDPRLLEFADMTAPGQGISLTDGDVTDGGVAWIIDGPILPGESRTIEFMVRIPDDFDGDDLVDGFEIETDADIPSYGGVADPTDDSRTYGDDPTDDVVSDPVGIELTIVEPGTSSLGDRVWFDFDRDGRQDPNEPGIPGVTIIVTSDGPDGQPGTADDVRREAVTGDDGIWVVDGLQPGGYDVTVDETTLPDSVEQTYSLQGGIDAPQPTVSNANLPDDTFRDDLDFGYVGTASIGDTIWWDRDEDGTQSDSTDDATREPGIEGVDVVVTWAGPDGTFGTDDDVDFTDETDDDGRYLVDGLPAGEFRVTVETEDLPDGFRATFDEDDGTDAPDSITDVTLDPGEDHRTADFGYVGDGSIGDTIYLDLDGDGTQSTSPESVEPGVPGQTVVVTWEGEDGAFNTADDETFELVTDENGNYGIDGLPDDRFRITVGTPDEPGITATATNTEDPDDGAPNTSEVELNEVDGRDRDDQDFGYVGDNSLGDTVWWDVDTDGIDDGALVEPRLDGVELTVTWFGPDRQPGGGDDVVVARPTTDENGEYAVTGLPDGRYAVEVDTDTIPDGFGNTVDPQGEPGDQADSADDRSTVQVGTNDAGDDIGNTNIDQDFGYAGTGSIGDTIYLDRNGNGQQDDGEPGIPNVSVVVIFAGDPGDPTDDIMFSAVTDDDGEYLVEGLPAGDYTVTVIGGLPADVENTDDPDAAPGEPGDSTSSLTLGTNPDGTVESNLDQDFGYDTTSAIGDRVWFDRDRDGVQDDDEPGIPGVEITVTFLGADEIEGTADDEVFTDTTDEDGNWLVTGIADGVYVVEVTGGVPDGFGPTYDDDSPADGTNTVGDERSELGVDAGDDPLTVIDLDQDFGYAGDAAVEGRIWLDRDGDGTEDAPGDEPGLAGVTVTITWFGPDGVEGSDDDVTFRVVTNQDGEYGLDGLPAGDYSITVDETDLPDGVVVTGDPDDDGDLTTEVTLTTGETVTDQDFGVQGTSSIGDTVFLDRDRDGEQGDADDEPGIPGVTVTLEWFGPNGIDEEPGEPTDDETFTTETDENGEYLFDGLPAGEYVVTLDDDTLPDGTEPTVDEDGGVADDGGTPDRSTPVKLGEDDDHLTADFGEVGPGSIGDTVYLDTDGDGVQDTGPDGAEPGLPGQPVTVIGEGADGVIGTDDDLIFPTVTDENGNYEVDGLPLGDYVVVVGDDEPGSDPDITDVADNTGDPDEGQPGDQPNESQVTLTVGEPTDEDQDFGYQGPNSLGDTVWFDDDGDGIEDGAANGEDPIEGVDVVVTWAGPDGTFGTADDVTLPAETTDDDGQYAVTGLLDGTYEVAVDETTVPDGLSPSADVGDTGTPDEGTSPDGTSTVTLEATDDGNGNITPDENLDQDFGYNDGATLSGTVVLDRNDSGDIDDGDAGLGGITVVLRDENGDVVDEAITDDNGDYTFTGLEPGDYTVDIDEDTLPDGVEPTFDPDGDADGDAPVTVGQNEDVTDVDFGYRGDGVVGDTIFLDLDGDGEQRDEPGVAGQPVTLTWAGPDDTLGTDDDVTIQELTNQNGEYLFDGLPDGTFEVQVGDGVPAEPGDDDAEITDLAENVTDPDGDDPNRSIVELSDGDRQNLDQDFGYRGVNSLGDLVWFDADADGEPAGDDDEPGIPGVDLTVTWFGLDGVEGTDDDALVGSTTTDDDGLYEVGGLPDGMFRVTVDDRTVPDGLSNTNDRGDAANGDDMAPTDGSSVVSLDSTDFGAGIVVPDEDLDQDFGYVDGGEISGTIVLDLDDNEQADDGEGIPGVTVQLVDPGDDGILGTPDDVIVDETMTDENGDYFFPGLPSGDYVVVVDPDGDTLPDGTAPNFDTDDGQPGDGDLNMPVTLEGNPDGTVDDATGVDAGVIGEGTIGDTIFLDLDGDGAEGDDEPGVPGQTVTLIGEGADGILGTDDDLVLTTETDDEGEYLFENLPDGDYTVVVGVPGEDGDAEDDGIADRADNTADPDGGDENTSSVTLSDPADGGTRDDLDQDFGYQGINELGDTIWFDDNADGNDGADDTEPGIPGVPVDVTWAGLDDVLGTDDDVELPAAETGAVTDENGEYSVTGLPDGTYEVTVDETADALDGLSNTADSADDAGDPVDGSSIAVFDGDDPTDNTDLTHDFGYTAGGTISGTIVLDLDDNGTADDGEGIPGVTVQLVDPGADGVLGTDDDVIVDETTTDDDGDYLFPGLPSGDYVVVVDPDGDSLPEGVEPSFDTDDGVPGNGDGIMPVTLEENPDGTVESVDDVDAGYVGEGTIGDTIYLDLDRDEAQGDDEPGVPGQTVTLTGAGADDTFGTDDDLELTDVTDDDGEYLFENLPDGDYIITVGVPGEDGDAADDGIADIADNTDDPDAGLPNTSEVTLQDGDREDLDQDFGYAGVNSLGDTVFLDDNADGIEGDDEDGISGVDVIVTWFGPDGVQGTADDVELPAATTNDDGEYLVENLPDGTYEVAVDETTIPNGLENTVDVGDAGTPDEGTSPDATSTVTLEATDDGNGGITPDENLDQDFGYVAGGSISGRIVFDDDGEGDDDADEPGVPGVTVTLTGPDGLERTTTTDENGEFSFPGLDAGDYVVTIDTDTLPDGTELTFDTDDGAPGDADGVQPVALGTNPDGTVQDVTDVDAGIEADGTIGDTVYLDTNGDGVQGDTAVGPEPGIPGQHVTLTGAGADGTFGTDDDIVRETTTDDDGEYLFENLPDGDYIVTIGSPDDPGITELAENTGDPDGGTPNESEVALEDGNREDLDQDFGYQGPNSLGDTVFLDENADGVQDPTDDGIADVTVKITWHGIDGVLGTSDDVEFTTETDTDGEYTAENLPDGTYTVMLDDTTLPADADPTVDAIDEPGDPIDGMSTVVLGDDAPNPDDVTSGEDEDGVDFGVVPGGSISGTVILDRDADDAQGVDEPGIPGVTVTLTGPGPDGIDGTDDDILRSTTTDENGDYSFPGLPAGDYEVTIDETTLPEGTTATFDTDPDGADNPDRTTSVTLSSTPDGDVEDVTDVDFGETGDGVIGGVVYVDQDGNEDQNDGEPGAPGQPVTITWAGPDGELGTDDDVPFTTVTDENGAYEVDGLPDGDYRIDIGPGLPDVADPTEDPDGGGDNTSQVTLDPENREETDQDFGYQGDNGVGDTVFQDADGSGTDDGAATDPRVEGADVTVTWYGPDGEPGTADDVPFPAATTDENGEYEVTGLPDGTYSVELDDTTIPAGTTPSVDPDGGTPDGVSEVTLEGGETNDEQDFGVSGGATLGDTVWLDLDGDGVRDLGEPGLTGATVTATFLGPDGAPGGGDDVVYTTTVDATGNYLFEGLPAGAYDITISGLPDGLNPTADPDGGDDSTSRVVLGVDETNLDQDFGYVGTAGITDSVYLDADGDGVRDTGESGIPDLPITITIAGADGVLGTDDDIVIATTTGPDGSFEVTGLPAGPATVSYDAADLPDGLEPLGDADGGDPTEITTELVAGETTEGEDFPVGGTSAMDGTVFNDIDGDGMRDPGETGVPNAVVDVTWDGPDGPVTTSVVTGPDGSWSIDNLPPGDYTVRVDPTTLPDGTTVAGGPIDVTLDPGETETVDIPVVGTGDIEGRIINDQDRDGVQDPGEPGATGITVVLIDQNGTEVDRTVTGPNGDYRFDDVPPGIYRVRVLPETIPAGQSVVSDPDGTIDGVTTVTVRPTETTDAGVFGIDIDGRVIPIGPNNPTTPNLPGTGSNTTGILVQFALFFALLGAALILAQRRRPGQNTG